MTKPQDDGEAVAPCTCGQSGHGNAHDPDCPRSDYKPIRSERQEAMAARDDGGYWDNSGRHHPARDDGMAVAWLRQILDGTSVKISSGDWRVENDHWHGITMSASFARALTRQLAEARAERDRIIEDRARFPDRPDDIGRMIQAHIGNLKAGKEAADEHARNAFAKLQVVRADLAEAHGVIAALVADIEDYERVNNLAPSPGKRDCWQSVTHAKDVLAQSAALRTEK